MLVLIGGILALVLGILSLVGYGIGRFGRFGDFSFGLGPIIEIVAGIIAIALYRQLGNLGVIIALLILGVVAGGIGGILIVIGAILALIAKYVPS